MTPLGLCELLSHKTQPHLISTASCFGEKAAPDCGTMYSHLPVSMEGLAVPTLAPCGHKSSVRATLQPSWTRQPYPESPRRVHQCRPLHRFRGSLVGDGPGTRSYLQALQSDGKARMAKLRLKRQAGRSLNTDHHKSVAPGRTPVPSVSVTSKGKLMIYPQRCQWPRPREASSAALGTSLPGAVFVSGCQSYLSHAESMFVKSEHGYSCLSEQRDPILLPSKLGWLAAAKR